MWIDFFSLIVAMFALFAVWHQIRSFNKNIQLNVFTTYTDRYSNILKNLPEEIFTKDISLDEARKLDPRIMKTMREYYDLTYEQWLLHDKSMIDDDYFYLWSEGIKTAKKRAAFSQSWVIINHTSQFPSGFVKFIESS